MTSLAQLCDKSISSFAGAIFISLVLSFWPSVAQGEEIRSFTSDLSLTRSGALTVGEEIVVDFGKAARHGIFRVIPVTYHRGAGTYSINLKLKSITDENGQTLPYNAERNGPDLNIKIGRPDSTVTGVHAYRIEYVVSRALNFFDGVPELYWNVTGNEWPFPISRCVAYFHPPTDVSLDDIRSTSFVGVLGSKSPGEIKQSEGLLTIKAAHLGPGQGLTVAIRLPKGAIAPPSTLDEVLGFLEDWLGLIVIPSLTAVILYFYWNAFGRDQKNITAVGVEWSPPPDLTPAEVGTLIDERCDIPDVVSTLVDLASRGYLQIKPVPYNGILLMSKKDYQFTKTQSPQSTPPLKPHEILFLNALFGGAERQNYLSSLKGKFSLDIPDIKRAIWAELAAKKLFARDPETERQCFYAFAVMLFICGIVVAIFGGNEYRATGGGLILAGLITGCAANAMPAKTVAGSIAAARCRAFQRFVKTAEKRRIAYLAKDDPTIFGRLLPYAMVLGAADQWASAFKDLMMQPPEWYDNSAFGGRGTFLPNVFVDDLGNSLKTISAGLAAPSTLPGSGGSGGWDKGAGGGFSGFDGGGVSGGGFGGGGGGSW